jgi:hypothetical protein
MSAVRASLLAGGAILLAATALRSPRVRADAPTGRFVVGDDGTVTDTTTKLVWQRAPLLDEVGSHEAGAAVCAKLAGFRLPTPKELVTLLDRRHAPGTACVDAAAFPNVVPEDAGASAARFLSSAVCEANQHCPEQGPVSVEVDLRTCAVVEATTSTCRVICVRGP